MHAFTCMLYVLVLVSLVIVISYLQYISRESFRPRTDASIVLSIGSLIERPTSRESTMFSMTSTMDQRSRKISKTESDVLEDEESKMGTKALAPGYGPPQNMMDEKQNSFTDYLELAPPSRRQCNIPHCCVYLAYGLCFGLIALSFVMVTLNGRLFTNTVTMKWLLACFVSFVISFIVIEPLRVILLSAIKAQLSGSIDRCEYELEFRPQIESNEKIKDSIRLRPVGGFALLNAKEEGRKAQRLKLILRQFIIYTIFLVIVLIINYAGHKSVEFHSTKFSSDLFTRQTFISGNDTTMYFNDIRTFDHYWDWLDQVMVPGLHSYDLDEQAVSGFNLGMGRLRQIRSLPSQPCYAEKALKDLGAEYILSGECYGSPSWTEDMSSYSIGWEPVNGNNTVWYHTQEDEIVYQGHIESYGGGGYIEVLGDSVIQTSSTIQLLKSQNWLDRATRAVFLELSDYIVGTPVFTTATILVEFPVSGSAIPTYRINSFEILNFISPFTLYAVNVFILLVICIVFFFVVIFRIKEEKSKYFGCFWNWMEMCVTLFGICSVSLYIHMVICCRSVYGEYLDRRDQFTSFTGVSHWIIVWRGVNAVLLFLIIIVVSLQ